MIVSTVNDRIDETKAHLTEKMDIYFSQMIEGVKYTGRVNVNHMSSMADINREREKKY